MSIETEPTASKRTITLLSLQREFLAVLYQFCFIYLRILVFFMLVFDGLNFINAPTHRTELTF